MPETTDNTSQQTTVARDRLLYAVQLNKDMATSIERVLDILAKYPECDADFVKVFNIQPPPRN